MKKVVLCAAIGALLVGAIPASAQVVIRDRDDVVVRENEHRDRGHHYGWYRGHHYGWYRSHAECRSVRVRTTLPNGTVIVKTRRDC